MKFHCVEKLKKILSCEKGIGISDYSGFILQANKWKQ
jgi:hypothetical protein